MKAHQRRSSDPSNIIVGTLGKPAMLRSALLFVNFFLIIAALYQIKPASRSLVLEVLSPEQLPFIWMLSAAMLFFVIGGYQVLLSRFNRADVTLGVNVAFIIVLWLFHWQLREATVVSATGFYLLVDLMGVMLVEQFWSQANSAFKTQEGKSWYGVIGAGGLLGGMAGSALAALLIRYTAIQTADLLLVAALVLTLSLLLSFVLSTIETTSKVMEELPVNPDGIERGGVQSLLGSRYLLLIAASLLMAQLVSPLVEYQFMQVVAEHYTETEQRTAMLSLFFSILSGVSIAINLLITPLILHFFGVFTGLMVQPVVLALTAYCFGMQGGVMSAAVMKLGDRGLAYSVTRASRELLYIPMETVKMYQAKAWIDMFGYRSFKLLGAFLILLLTQWTNLAATTVPLGSIVVVACIAWILILLILSRHYESLVSEGLRSVEKTGGAVSV